MKEKISLRWFFIKLAGVFFAVYSVYCVFIIFNGISKDLTTEGVVTNVLYAVFYAVFSFFAFTSEVKDIRFLTVRRIIFIAALLAELLLRLRSFRFVIYIINFSNPLTVLLGATYIMPIVGMLIILANFAFLSKNLLQHPKSSVLLPLSAMLLFLCSVVLEMIQLFKYSSGSNGITLRSIIITPVFYLGWICLSVYFMYPPKSIEDPVNFLTPNDDDFIVQSDSGEYIPPVESEPIITIDTDLIIPDDTSNEP